MRPARANSITDKGSDPQGSGPFVVPHRVYLASNKSHFVNDV
jgi:hypothetical protein